MRWAVFVAVGGLLLGQAAPALSQDTVNGEQVFRKCRACHAAGPGAANKVGPHLNGVVGRKAGSVPGFNYSEAMRDAGAGGLVWTEDKLAGYLASPVAFMQKNKMAFAGVKNETELNDLIAYLKTLN